MRADDPVVIFLLVLVIGIVGGILFDRLAGPSWLTRQFSGSTRGIFTNVLVGVAGPFLGYQMAMLAFGGGWYRCRAVRLANAQVTESQPHSARQLVWK